MKMMMKMTKQSSSTNLSSLTLKPKNSSWPRLFSSNKQHKSKRKSQLKSRNLIGQTKTKEEQRQ